MNKLLSALFFVYTISFNTSAFAEQALSKALIQQYAQTTQQLEQFMEGTPDVDKKLTEAMLKGKGEVISLIKSLGVYPEVKAKVTSAGFSDVEQYLETSLRIVGAVFNAQMKLMPKGMGMDFQVQQMTAQIEQMKKQGVPPEVVSQMETTITQQLEGINLMQELAKHASAADVQFISDNLEWVMQALPIN